jgi:hypothetical protein
MQALSPKLKPAERYNALHQLGITKEIVTTAILLGELERDNCTLHDPLCVPGIFAWSRCSRSMRDQLVPLGWKSENDQNRALIVSPNGLIAIAAVSGDDGTGDPNLVPNLKIPAGSATKRAVNANHPTLFRMHPTAEEVRSSGKRQTWLLLRRPTANFIFAELSLPGAMADGRVVYWLDRIILDPIPHEFSFTVDPDSGDSGEIDIPVLKRQ